LIYELHGRTRENYDIRHIIEEIRVKNCETKQMTEPEAGCSTDRRSEAAVQDRILNKEDTPKTKLDKVRMLFFICILLLPVYMGCVCFFKSHGIQNPIPAVSGIMTAAALCMYAAYKIYDSRAILTEWIQNITAGQFHKEKAMEHAGREKCTAIAEEIRQNQNETILRLVSDNTIDTMIVSKTPYLIGSDESAADGCIMNSSVSRIHARIERIAGSFFLEDMGSGNGTFYNGIRIEGEEKVRLLDSDTVCFSGKEYTVSLR